MYGRRSIKTDFGGHDNRHYNNTYAYVNTGLYVTGTLPEHESWFVDNKVVLNGNTVGTASGSGQSESPLTLTLTLTGQCELPLGAFNLTTRNIAQRGTDTREPTPFPQLHRHQSALGTFQLWWDAIATSRSQARLASASCLSMTGKPKVETLTPP